MDANRKIRSADDRAALASEFNASGMTQEAFARVHGVTARALRNWLREAAPVSAQRGIEEARAIIDDAIEKLERLRERLVPAEVPVRSLPMEEQRPRTPERLPSPVEMWNLG